MRLSINENSPDYDMAIRFIDKILLDGVPIANCISLDTAKGEVVCYNMPLEVTKAEELAVHVRYGKVKIVWRSTQPASQRIINEFLAKSQELPA